MVVARRDFDPATFDPKGKLLDLVQDLTLLAMVGIVDPPRAEAKDAIAKCHSAGIQVRMITGDHAVTAAAIGHELGIEGQALTGAQFAAIPDEQLKPQLDQIGVGGPSDAGGQDPAGDAAPAEGQHRCHDRRRRQ